MNEKPHGYLSAAFKRLNKDIDQLFGKNEQLEGIIFMSHKYSIKDLMNSHEFDDIRSIAEKMASDIDNWKANKQISSATMRVYNVNRDLLENRLKRLEYAIKNREKTFWDYIEEFFNKLWFIVSKILPEIYLKALTDLKNKPGFIGGVARTLIAWNKTVDRKLISNNDKFISEND
jgi:hypothetical protein